MKTYQSVEILNKIKEDDKEFLKSKRKKYGAATFCLGCKENTSVGLYPFWHRYARSLCGNCGEEYEEFLEEIGAINEKDK